MEIERIIKYEGNERYFIGLFKGKDDENNEKFYVIYAFTNSPLISSELEEYSPENLYDFDYHFNIIKNKIYKAIIPFKIGENGKAFIIICIENEKDYNLIKSVVESLA